MAAIDIDPAPEGGRGEGNITPVATYPSGGDPRGEEAVVWVVDAVVFGAEEFEDGLEDLRREVCRVACLGLDVACV